MKRFGFSLIAVAAAIFLSSAVSFAHEECDDGEARPSISGKPIASAPSLGASAASVTVKLFQYQPGRIQVKTGTTVTWINDDEILHTVTMENKSGSFDAPLDGKGKSFSFTFTQPGTYSYYCDRHEHMRGEVEVR